MNKIVLRFMLIVLRCIENNMKGNYYFFEDVEGLKKDIKKELEK